MAALCETSMKYIFVYIFVIAVSGCSTLCTMPLSKVAGEIKIDGDGYAQITECETGVIYQVGTLTSNQYFGFQNEYEKLVKTGKVFAVVEGTIRSKKNVLDFPVFKKLKNGSCG